MRLTMGIWKELVFEAVLFAAGAAEIALCYHNSVVLTALVVATAIPAIAFWRKSHALCIFLVGALIGGAGEAICANAGAWTYANPTFLAIPIWLPLSWGLVTVLVVGVAGTVAKMGTK